MTEQIVDAVVKLLEQGGARAVWLWTAYLVVELLKYVVGMGIVWYLCIRGYRLFRGLQQPRWCQRKDCDKRETVLGLKKQS